MFIAGMHDKFICDEWHSKHGHRFSLWSIWYCNHISPSLISFSFSSACCHFSVIVCIIHYYKDWTSFYMLWLRDILSWTGKQWPLAALFFPQCTYPSLPMPLPMIGDTNNFMCYLLPSQWTKTLSFTLSQILGTGVLQSLQELSACCRTWQMGQQTTVSRVWLLCVACLAKCVMVSPPNFLLLNQNPDMALT